MRAIAAAAAAFLAVAAALPEPMPDPLVVGERTWLKCFSCHSLRPGVTLTGPSLNGVIGSKVAAKPRFAYSLEMRQFAIDNPIWTPELVERYVAAPEQMVPGTTMTFPGMPDAAERSELIAYLKGPAGRMR